MSGPLWGTTRRVTIAGARLIYLGNAYSHCTSQQGADDLMDQLQQQIDVVIALKHEVWKHRGKMRDDAEQFPW